MSELVREALRRYHLQTDVGFTSPLAMALANLQAEALANGSSKLSKRQIDAEIAAARRARRKKTAKPPAK